MKDNIIGHFPRKISFACHLFSRHSGSIWCEVIGGRHYSKDLIHGDLEVPCIIFFSGPLNYVLKVKKLVEHAMAKKNI